MNFETLSDTPRVVRETQVGRDAAERFRKDGNRAAIDQLNANVTVTAT